MHNAIEWRVIDIVRRDDLSLYELTVERD